MTAILYLTLVAVLSTATGQNPKQESNSNHVPLKNRQQQLPPIPIYYTLQLPKLQDPVPFYNPEISSDLQPPPNSYYNVPVVFYEYPTPSQDLQPPNAESWNPNNEEAYYYPSEFGINPSEVEQPTNSHPKKYNKDVHEKLKLSNPKGSDSPGRTTDDLEQRRKTLERFSKAENKKQIEDEKAQSSI